MRRSRVIVVTALVASAAQIVAAGQASAATPVKYKNCAQLNQKYPHGVGRAGAVDHVASRRDVPVRNFTVNTALYNANKGLLDRDKDGIACEKR